MGEHNVDSRMDEAQLRAFTKSLLQDLQALERMIDRGMFESGVRRIGAEQEMFLIDDAYRPAPLATEVLAELDSPKFTTELARFNLEANLTPLSFGGDCLSRLEAEIEELLGAARRGAEACGARVLLTGILPSLRLADLGLDNMTPVPRYLALNHAMRRMRGRDFQFLIKGLDELEVTHDNIMLESANTSFQIHFQVAPDEFARLYNLAQAVTAPVLAAAVNSPLLLGRRLWHETRVALFQQSIDVRSAAHQARGLRPRVSFGEGWIKRSILEIFREDVARFRILLATGIGESPLAEVDSGRAPKLTALRLHNGTVYRWNRPCYGVHDGVPHLRIESRVLPAGPTVKDEIANAALFYGLMSALGEEYEDVAKVMPFDDAKGNFVAAARHGLKAQFTWLDQKTYTAGDLLLDHLLPMAHAGLESRGVDGDDIDGYLQVVAERVRSEQTGAQWMLSSHARLANHSSGDACARELAAALLERQLTGRPVHTWDVAKPRSGHDWRSDYKRVEQVMTTDLFTVRPQDLVDLAASFMEWEHIRHVPVEDDEGRLVGIVSHRSLLRLIARGANQEPVAVSDIMKPNPVTVAPGSSTLESIQLMREHRVSCLPVVANERLVGIITEADLIYVAGRLLEDKLREA